MKKEGQVYVSAFTCCQPPLKLKGIRFNRASCGQRFGARASAAPTHVPHTAAQIATRRMPKWRVADIDQTVGVTFSLKQITPLPDHGQKAVPVDLWIGKKTA